MPVINIFDNGVRTPVQVVVCPDCGGSGFIVIGRHDKQIKYKVPCRRCKGIA